MMHLKEKWGKEKLKVLIVSSGVYSTPPKDGDAIAKLVFELAKSLSENFDIDITIFDIQSEGYDKFNKINNNLKIVRIKIPTWIKGKLRHIIFSLCSAIYALFNGINIVHCNTQWQVFLNKLFFRKVIFTSHSPLWTIKRQKGEILSTKFSDIPVAISYHIYNEMRKINKNVTLIPNGINTEKYIPNYIDMQNKNSILFVGKICERKGVDMLIYAYEKLPQALKNKFVLDIVGPFASDFGSDDTKFYEKLYKHVESKNIKNIIFHGSKTENELVNYYNKAGVFVLPSKSEGLPLVILEAMACGVPCIVNEFPGIKYHFPKESGVLTYKYNDVDDLIDKLHYILTLDDDEYYKLSKKVRKYVESKFSWKIISKEYFKLYNKLL